MLRWQSETESWVRQCGLRIPEITGRLGVLNYGRAPRHWSREASCNSKPRRELSAQGCHIMKIGTQLGDCSPIRGPGSGRTVVIFPISPQEEQHRCTPQESSGFGDLKWSCVLEIEMLGCRLDEYTVWVETKETGVTGCFFPVGALKCGAPNSGFWGWRLIGHHFLSHPLKWHGKTSGN